MKLPLACLRPLNENPTMASESRIVPALGPIIHSYDYLEAKADEVIVDFKLINVEIGLDHDDVNWIPMLSGEGDGLARRNADPSEGQRLHEVASRKIARSTEHAMRVPWAAKLALCHRGERVIIFHERVVSLERITNLLSKFGQNSVAYHSQLAESHRRDNLRLFRRGMVNMLVTCRALGRRRECSRSQCRYRCEFDLEHAAAHSTSRTSTPTCTREKARDRLHAIRWRGSTGATCGGGS